MCIRDRLNGALLDSNKYELELFGEEKENGSISYGALEKANGGTLLVDQVSEIPLDIQSKILRVLTDQKFKRVNGSSDVTVDVRLMCSSSKDLKKEIFKLIKKGLPTSIQNKFNFEVNYITNPDRETFLIGLSDFLKSSNKEDNLLIYFAGHLSCYLIL